MRVFVAAPFTQLIGAATRTMDHAPRAFLEGLQAELAAKQHTTFLAHQREEWGEALMSPTVYAPLDLQEMVATDVVCAFGGKPASGGVMIELGWASSHAKPALLVLSKDERYSPLITGLSAITAVDMLWVDEWTRTEPAAIVDALEALWSRHRGRRTPSLTTGRP